MLIEAAKGGHTGVVSVLIDYNPGSIPGQAAAVTAAATAANTANAATAETASTGDVVSDTAAAAVAGSAPAPAGVDLIPATRFPAEGHEAASGQPQQSAVVPAPPPVAPAGTSSAQTGAPQPPSVPTSLPNKSK